MNTERFLKTILLIFIGAVVVFTFLFVIGHTVFIKDAEKILIGNIHTPSDIDKLWKLYFSTKNPKAIEKIVSVLYWAEEGNESKAVLGKTADWSLAYNAQKDPALLAVLRELVAKAEGQNGVLLSDIVHNVENGKRVKAYK